METYRSVSFLSLALLGLFAAGCSGGSGNCPDCGDDVDCTRDVCDQATGLCLHVPDDDLCPADQICDPAGGCRPAASCSDDGDCDDGNPCTDDFCRQGSCRREFNSAPCDDGDPCTSGDSCAAGSCQPGQNICQCQEDADCAPLEDGDACNGTLKCADGQCQVDPATVVNCDTSDDSACRKNTCQPQSGQCLMQDVSDGTGCDDGDPCTQGDSCQAGQCSGTARDCDDGNPCTDDSCNPDDGGCLHPPNSAACDDGNACTSGDTCSAGQCRGRESCCDDNLDNDGDGPSDCQDPDCAGDPACGQCQPVEVPEEPEFDPLPGESPPGRCESTSRDGFSDEYLYDNQDYVKVGIRRDWGGTIIYYGLAGGTGPGMNGSNVIDANDTGREVQVAFYDPDRAMQNCAWDAGCRSRASDCPNSITFLGWNPVQGGNRCNRGSGVDSVTCSDGMLSATVTPLFWNPTWDRRDCFSDVCSDPNQRDRRSAVQVVQSVKFIRRHVLQLDYTVTNPTDTGHAATGQEMPTVYTANGQAGPDLWRMFTSDGREILIDTQGNDQFYHAEFESPGGWATMQNDDLSYGVGLYNENRNTSFQAWQSRSLPFNNFRPIFTFAIPAQGFVRARAYLILGSRDTVAAEAAWLDGNLPPFGVLDSPAAEAQLSGAVAVWGWALDNKGVAGVELLLDGSVTVPLQYGTSRPDVCLAWPGYDHVGFSGTLDTSGLSACQHLLELRAWDNDGNSRILARRRISVTH